MILHSFTSSSRTILFPLLSTSWDTLFTQLINYLQQYSFYGIKGLTAIFALAPALFSLFLQLSSRNIPFTLFSTCKH